MREPAADEEGRVEAALRARAAPDLWVVEMGGAYNRLWHPASLTRLRLTCERSREMNASGLHRGEQRCLWHDCRAKGSSKRRQRAWPCVWSVHRMVFPSAFIAV